VLPLEKITVASESGRAPLHNRWAGTNRANVSARNLSGGIDADFGRAWRAPCGHRLEAALNGGGTQIRVHNVNGGISIHANWSRRPSHPAS